MEKFLAEDNIWYPKHHNPCYNGDQVVSKELAQV